MSDAHDVERRKKQLYAIAGVRLGKTHGQQRQREKTTFDYGWIGQNAPRYVLLARGGIMHDPTS